MSATPPPGDAAIDGGYTITWLEMTHRPPPGPDLPVGQSVALIAAEQPPLDYVLWLYRTVGHDYHWTDLLDLPADRQMAFVGDPKVRLYTVMVTGWPGGFFMLDTRKPETCDLAYFGLMPQAIGRGLGPWLLGCAIQAGWDSPGVTRMTVNTCTLDHPKALGLYQRMGFVPIRREERSADR